MKSERATFKNADGIELAARFDCPSAPRGVAIFAHCFTCAKNISAVRRIAGGLAQRGIAVLSFDFTGLGESEGEFAASHFSHQADDIVAAANFVRQQYAYTPTLLIGHSLGGTAALYAARRLPSIVSVATIGSPSDPAHVTNLIHCDIDNIPDNENIEISIGGRPFNIDRQFVDDLRAHPPATWAHDLNKSVLLLHSPVDTVVGIEHAEKLFGALRHPKSFVSLRHADHMLTNRDDAEFAAAVIAGWVDTTLSPAQDRAIASDSARHASTDAHHATEMTRGHQAMASIGLDPFRTEVYIAPHHHIVADEPSSVGGTETGATPFGLLLSSLGACTVMTLQVYARRKGIDMQRAQVFLDYHAKPEPHITRALLIEGNITEQVRGRLLQIADLCPIHKLLTGTVPVHTTYKQQSAPAD